MSDDATAPQPGTDPAAPGPEPDGDPAPAVDAVVDARGLRCPLPVIRLAELVRDDDAVRRVTVLATDPAAAHDIPAWCRMRGHRFVQARDEGDHTAYDVEVVRPRGPATVP